MTKNPLDPKLTKELCPLTQEDLEFLYAKVDGFGQQASMLDKNLFNPQIPGQNNRILVCGPKGSGRRSVVNYIIWRFCEANNIELTKNPLIKAIVKDDHDIKPIQDLLSELHYHLRKCLGEKFNNELNNLYKEEVILREEPAPVHTYKSIFRESNSILTGLKKEDKNNFPILLLEDIRNCQQISQVKEVFEENYLILFTTSKIEIGQWLNYNDGLVVNLNPLNLEDIKNFLEHRWKNCLDSNKKHPFNEDGLNYVFEKPREFQFVTNVLTKIFNKYGSQSTISKEEIIQETCQYYAINYDREQLLKSLK